MRHELIAVVNGNYYDKRVLHIFRVVTRTYCIINNMIYVLRVVVIVVYYTRGARSRVITGVVPKSASVRGGRYYIR